jgi:hypothetical protein
MKKTLDQKSRDTFPLYLTVHHYYQVSNKKRKKYEFSSECNESSRKCLIEKYFA